MREANAVEVEDRRKGFVRFLAGRRVVHTEEGDIDAVLPQFLDLLPLGIDAHDPVGDSSEIASGGRSQRIARFRARDEHGAAVAFESIQKRERRISIENSNPCQDLARAGKWDHVYGVPGSPEPSPTPELEPAVHDLQIEERFHVGAAGIQHLPGRIRALSGSKSKENHLPHTCEGHRVEPAEIEPRGDGAPLRVAAVPRHFAHPRRHFAIDEFAEPPAVDAVHGHARRRRLAQEELYRRARIEGVRVVLAEARAGPGRGFPRAPVRLGITGGLSGRRHACDSGSSWSSGEYRRWACLPTISAGWAEWPRCVPPLPA